MRERQAAQLSAAFILKARRPVGLVRLLKLVYLAEREAVRRSGAAIVMDDIYAMEAGMVLSRTFDLMKGKAGTPTTGEWAEFIAPPSERGINVRRGVGQSLLDGLSPDDMSVVEDVWAKHGSMTRDELVHDVHHGLEEWVEFWGGTSRRSRAVHVPYDQLLRTVRGVAGGDSGQAETTTAHDFVDHLLSIPCVGQDDDFRRDAFPPREVDLGL